jgi:hypothetical protein
VAYLNDRVYDNGLTVLDTEVTHLYITSQEASTFADATTTYALASKATPTVGAPSARSGGGRKVTVSAITDGAVATTGTGTHYALTDATNSRLLAAGPLSASQVLTALNVFTLTAFDIGIPGPA